MTRRSSPRPDDVARWVAVLTAPIPPNYGGAALSDIRTERRNAAGKLAEWDLGKDGKPKAEAPR